MYQVGTTYNKRSFTHIDNKQKYIISYVLLYMWYTRRHNNKIKGGRDNTIVEISNKAISGENVK